MGEQTGACWVVVPHHIRKTVGFPWTPPSRAQTPSAPSSVASLTQYKMFFLIKGGLLNGEHI